MDNNQQNIDKLFRDNLKDYKKIPSPDVWKNIQGNIQRKYNSKKIILFRAFRVAAVLILIIVAAWMINQMAFKKEDVVVESQSIPEITEDLPLSIANNSEEIEEDFITDQVSKQIAEAMNVTDETNQYESDLAIGVQNVLFQTEVEENTILEIFTMIKRIEIGDIFSRATRIKDNLQPINIQLSTDPFEFSEEDRFVIAQNISGERRNNYVNNRWEVGMQIVSGFSSQSASYTNNYERAMAYPESKGLPTLGGGLSVEYETGSKWSIESGIFYSRNNQKSINSVHSSFKDIVLESISDANFFNTPIRISEGELISMNSIAGVIQVDETPENTELAGAMEDNSFTSAFLNEDDFQHTFDFIQIPFYLRYNIIDSNIDVQVMGGINTNFLVGNNVYMIGKMRKDYIGKTKDIANINFSGTVGIGFEYKLGPRISVSVEPRISYFLNSLNRSEEVNNHPYSFNLYTGVNYNF